MWTALLAFAGGVIAVALKGYVDYILERRRERRALDMAARLVHEELWQASVSISNELWIGDIPSPDNFSDAAWQEHKALVGGALDFENWRWVSVAYAAVMDARDLSAKAHKTGVNEELRGQLLHLQHMIASARDAVGELIKGIERDPLPGDDAAYDLYREAYERRQRRSRLIRKLRTRTRRWLRAERAGRSAREDQADATDGS